MNRKVATLIILVVFVLTLVLVSILGSNPKEWAINKRIKSIYIANEVYGSKIAPNRKDGDVDAWRFEIRLGDGDLNPENDPLVKQIKKGESVITFYYGIEPTRAKDLTVDIVLPEPETDDPNAIRLSDYIQVKASEGAVTITWLKFKDGAIDYAAWEGGFGLSLIGDNGSASASVYFSFPKVTEGEADL